jgi:hypothetical protein
MGQAAKRRHPKMETAENAEDAEGRSFFFCVFCVFCGSKMTEPPLARRLEGHAEGRLT